MRKVAILTVFFIVAGLAFASNDVWKTKPYQQWDSNDVKEVLTSSPWVKKTTVMASWAQGRAMPPAGQGQQTQGQQTQGQGQTAQRPGSMNGTAGGSAGTNTQNVGNQGPQMPEMGQATFFVRWSSSQTIREAVARSALLNSQFSEAQVEQYVNQEPTTYAILLYGPDMTPFLKESEDTLKSEAYLEVKPSKEKVPPSDVKITKDPGSDKIVSVAFVFPKQGTNGQPLIGANDKQAQFDCKLKMAHVSTQFDLRKMTGKNGEDL